MTSSMGMKLNKNLNEFNQRLADDLLPSFPDGIKAVQSEDETLLFRGVCPNSDDPNHVGSHVAVDLTQEVKEAIKNSSPANNEEMIEDLISNLGTQVRATYNKDHIGRYALSITGGMEILD